MKNNILHIDTDNISDPTVRAIANTLNSIVSDVRDGRVKQMDQDIKDNKSETDDLFTDAYEMIIDHEYRLVLSELGITEE